jgi:quinoprotein glucose dehydrogenase
VEDVWRRSGNTHYSPLIKSAANFNNLQIAWRFKTDNPGPQPEYNLNPRRHGQRHSHSTAAQDAPLSLDAGTGELIWKHAEREGARGSAAPRIVRSWIGVLSDGREEQSLYVTPGYRLIALDAKTGTPVRFAKTGP